MSKLREMREAKNLTVRAAAEKLQRGTATVSRYENGKVRRIDSDLIERMADLYETSPQQIKAAIPKAC